MEDSPALGPGRRVLVLDASPSLTLMICGLLHGWGVAADAASPPDDAAAIALVIADPAADPARLAALRAAGIPWLALLPREAIAHAAEAEAHAEKPLRPAELRAALRIALNAAAPIDHAAIAVLWGNAADPGFRRVVAAFAAELQQRLAAIAASTDRPHLGREAHSIAGAAATVGAAAIARAARALETAMPTADAPRIAALAAQLRETALRDLPALRALAAGP